MLHKPDAGGVCLSATAQIEKEVSLDRAINRQIADPVLPLRPYLFAVNSEFRDLLKGFVGR